jgi:hypothetical protein
MSTMNEDPAAGDPRRRVPPYVALVRIAAVIGMSAFGAAGIFLFLLGIDYVLWGVLAIALALPCFFVMRLVERTAERPEDEPEISPR